MNPEWDRLISGDTDQGTARGGIEGGAGLIPPAAEAASAGGSATDLLQIEPDPESPQWVWENRLPLRAASGISDEFAGVARTRVASQELELGAWRTRCGT